MMDNGPDRLSVLDKTSYLNDLLEAGWGGRIPPDQPQAVERLKVLSHRLHLYRALCYTIIAFANNEGKGAASLTCLDLWFAVPRMGAERQATVTGRSRSQTARSDPKAELKSRRGRRHRHHP